MLSATRLALSPALQVSMQTQLMFANHVAFSVFLAQVMHHIVLETSAVSIIISMRTPA